jgi:hypothetical protein
MMRDKLELDRERIGSGACLLKQKTTAGLHDFIVDRVLRHRSPAEGPLLISTQAAEPWRCASRNVQVRSGLPRGRVPFVPLDLDQPDFGEIWVLSPFRSIKRILPVNRNISSFGRCPCWVQ